MLRRQTKQWKQLSKPGGRLPWPGRMLQRTAVHKPHGQE